MTKLAVIGSRKFMDYQKMKSVLSEIPGIESIVSGGANGADTLAEKYARENGIPIEVIEPDYEKYPGKIAPVIRNTEIARKCDMGVAFFPHEEMDGGTFDCIKKIRKLGKTVLVYTPSHSFEYK